MNWWVLKQEGYNKSWIICELCKVTLTRCDGVDYEGFVTSNKSQWLHQHGSYLTQVKGSPWMKGRPLG